MRAGSYYRITEHGVVISSDTFMPVPLFCDLLDKYIAGHATVTLGFNHMKPIGKLTGYILNEKEKFIELQMEMKGFDIGIAGITKNISVSTHVDQIECKGCKACDEAITIINEFEITECSLVTKPEEPDFR